MSTAYAFPKAVHSYVSFKGKEAFSVNVYSTAGAEFASSQGVR